MRNFGSAWIVLVFPLALFGASTHLAAVRTGLRQMAVDPSATFRVRELEISKGGVKFYLSEGVLAFATPVDGHRVAAVFTTAFVDAGDAEVISLPPLAAERASLARFTNSPNLDEHFTSALLFFADDTADELQRQIQTHPLHPAPELGVPMGKTFDEVLRGSATELEVRIGQSILDRHASEKGFFYGMLAGRTLHGVDFVFQPEQPDTLVFGRVANRAAPNAASSYFQVWAAYRPRNAPPGSAFNHISDYRIDTTIRPDLTMTSTADFDYEADADDGSVITLMLTPRLRVTEATIDGQPAGLLIHDSPRTEDIAGAQNFLLASEIELAPGSHHRVRIHYEGSVIRRTANGAYFVDDRNAWFPLMTPMLTVFDLTFHCPANLRLVATGEPISEEVVNGQRTVHRRTAKAQVLAGFNLGEFQVTTQEGPPYRIEICSNVQDSPAPNLAEQTEHILKYFTERWMPLTGHSVSVSPIEGYFGQGFPGLIYLSNISYLQEKDRPQVLRNSALDSFFSQLLLPHELAHQWWGNVVAAADYRSNWIVEAMSNYAALQYMEQAQGREAMDEILNNYREDLTKPTAGGELVDSYGPVTFGERLENNFGEGIWHDILYEKGTWIFNMLRERMGSNGFHDFQQKVLHDFSNRPITNEDLREEAARFIPANQPDRHLTSFFDTWVYDTGIPTLRVRRGMLQLSDVPDSYTVDVPLRCGAGATTWVRVNSGELPLPGRNCVLPDRLQFLFKN